MQKFAKSILLAQLKVVRCAFGNAFIKMNFRFFSQLVSANEVLRLLGATVGSQSHIASDICVYNLENWSCRNLIIGSNVYIGPRCLFDLTSQVRIDDQVSVSAQVSFITHLDVGNQPLKQRIPRKEGPIHVRKGAWIGVNTTVLHGVTVGEYAMVGAMSLVNQEIPRECVAVGIPCKVVRRLEPIDVKESERG